MKFLMIATYYDKYLQSLPERPAPRTGSAWNARVQDLLDDAFGMGHMISPEMSALGWDASTIVCNDPVSQSLWCAENGIRPGSLASKDVVAKQIEAIRPDVLYVLDPITYDSGFLRTLSFRPRIVAGWRAAPIPRETDFSAFDLGLTSADSCRRSFLSQGCGKVERHHPGFRRGVWEKCKDEPRLWDLVFCGQWSNEHVGRNKLLLDIAKEPLLGHGEFSLGYHLFRDPSVSLPAGVAMHERGPRWGLAMFRALRSGRTALHLPIDMAESNPLAMRVFESTGMGVALVVNRDPHLNEFFRPDEEVVTYESAGEIASKLVHFQNHPDELDRIARAGQERCFREHSMEVRARELDKILRSLLGGGKASAASQTSSERPRHGNPTIQPNDPEPIVDEGRAMTSFQMEDQEIQNLVDSGLKAIESGDPARALEIAIQAKALRKRRIGIDMLRAVAFLRLGRREEGLESLREELRAFPDNAPARSLFEQLGGANVPAPLLAGDEFSELLSVIRPYTMLSVERLRSLYEAAVRICRMDLPGNFLECGVAAGGSSALVSAVIARHSKRPRMLYSLDTFEGMPPPALVDTHSGIPADQTGWGTGTCAAPVESLLEACAKLGSTRHVRPIKGLFQETLPKHREEIGSIALLHMDGDWFDSTMAILDNVYDQVEHGGFVQIDDYGHWEGCKKAIHEYESRMGYRFSLTRIDSTGASMEKTSDQKYSVPSSAPAVRQPRVALSHSGPLPCPDGSAPLERTFPRVGFGSHVQILGRAETAIGEGSIVGEDAWLNVAIRDGSRRLTIGRCVCIGRHNVLSTSGHLEIGDYCLFGPQVYISDTDHVFADPFRPYVAQGQTSHRNLVVEENCWIGFGAVVTGGIRIGRGSVIGANAVVRSDIEPFSVVVGSNARVVKMYDPVRSEWIRTATEDDIAEVRANRSKRPLPDRDEYRSMLWNCGLREITPLAAGGDRTL